MRTKAALFAVLVLSISALGAAAPPQQPPGAAPPPDLSWLQPTMSDAAVAFSTCCVTSRVKCEQTCLRPPNCGVAQFTCNATSLTTCQPTCRCFFCE